MVRAQGRTEARCRSLVVVSVAVVFCVVLVLFFVRNEVFERWYIRSLRNLEGSEARANAVAFLRDHGTERAIHDLLGCLREEQDTDESVVIQTPDGLKPAPRNGVGFAYKDYPPIMFFWDLDDQDAIILALIRIAERRGERAKEELLGALGDPDWYVRYLSLCLLGVAMNDIGGIRDQLKACCSDPAEIVRDAAVFLLERRLGE